jgi:hypothetical protein
MREGKMDMGRGTRVRCIRDDWDEQTSGIDRLDRKPELPVRDCIYTIKDVLFINEYNYFILEEIDPRVYLCGCEMILRFRETHFAPIGGTNTKHSIEIFRKIDSEVFGKVDA